MPTGLSGFARYALYYAPGEDERLWAFGRDWLGVDGHGVAATSPLRTGLSSDEVRQITAEPARYTLHATLKAPFQLLAGRSAEELANALQSFCSRQARLRLPPLRLTRLERFLALTPTGDAPALAALADALVREFDGFRAPLQAADRERRLHAGLSSRQLGHLDSWGYPYVFEDFRFHVTLTGALPPHQIEAVETMLAPLTERTLSNPFCVSSVCLFGDPGAGGTFRLLRRFPLQPQS